MTDPFISLSQPAHPARLFETPILLDGELARRGSGPITMRQEAAEAGFVDLELLGKATNDPVQFDGWDELSNWVNFVDYLNDWAPHLTGVITCRTQQQRVVFHDGHATLLEGEVVYPDAATADMRAVLESIGDSLADYAKEACNAHASGDFDALESLAEGLDHAAKVAKNAIRQDPAADRRPQREGLTAMAKPAPTWTAAMAPELSRFGGPLAVIYGPMGDRIADVPSDPGQDPMPRARLLAASPEMQAALAAIEAKADKALTGLADTKASKKLNPALIAIRELASTALARAA